MNIKDIFEDALPILYSFAPTIATAIGGPLGLATGYVIPILASAFSGNSGNLPELAAKIATDNEAKSKLQTLENQHAPVISSLSRFVNNLDNAEISIKLSWK